MPVIINLARQPTALGIIIPSGDPHAGIAAEIAPIGHGLHPAGIIITVSHRIGARAVLQSQFAGEQVRAADGGAVGLRDGYRLQHGVVGSERRLRRATNGARIGRKLARIEIKARDVASGKILDVDRQTSVAVDLAENVAAKTALQNAADALAERIVPKLLE